MSFNRKLLMKTIAIGATLLTCTTTVQAANWLMLQGAERNGQSPRARVWGFIQPEYQTTSGTKIKAGPWKGQNAIFNQIGPDLKTNSQFGIRRARIGVRGTGFPLDPNVNYFFLAEFGNNGITRPGGGAGSAKITDASITLNHIKGARIRVGQFKTPGAEEGLQAIHVFNYINFTNVTNGLLLERFFDGDGSDKNDPNRPNGPVGAFRDVGVQVFDAFDFGAWEHSYAVMIGNGNGIARGDNNNSKELYLYWSSALIFDNSTGPRRQSLKMFGWYQNGKRTLTKAGAGTYDRTRSGVGFTFHKGKYQSTFEYINADGMIFNGTDGAAIAGSKNNANSATASFNIETKGKANGWYGSFGYNILSNLELDLRYDTYDRMTNVAKKERQFDTTTVGAQYFFNKKSRATINYEFRNAKAPNLPSSSGANQILSGLDDRLSVSVITIF